MPSVSYLELKRELERSIPAVRLISDPLRLLTYGTDASFYRLVPKLVVVADTEEEVRAVLAACRRHGAPVTFRAAGTSLSGQAVTDSVLLMLGEGWRGCEIGADAETIRLQPGVLGGFANRKLAPHGRKIGPDPASLEAAMIGGIAANNASGMCCGTAQNSYRTLHSARIVFADGAVLDTGDPGSRAEFVRTHADFVGRLEALAERVRGDATLAERIRRKYKMKNTTGYSLNALVDYEDPIDVLAHLMIGSEGTLGFLSEITYRTVPEHPHRATALILFNDLETACRAVTALKATPVVAVELADRAALTSVQAQPGIPPSLARLGPDGAGLLVETAAASADAVAANLEPIHAALAGLPTFEPIAFTTDPAESARLWKVRKGMFPSVGAMRATGTTVIIEDVTFPIERLAEATLDLQQLMRDHGYAEGIIFGHALEGNLHFVFTQDFNHAAEVERYAGFMEALSKLVVDKYDGALKAEHGTGRNMAPYVELEWGSDAYALMREIKRLFDPENLLNPGVILNDDPQIHLKNLKPLPAADPLVDKCIECGFCEPKCPSRAMTLTPRQRIVGWREIARIARESGRQADYDVLHRLYDYQGIDTCAACGLCATACPVNIETGLMVKRLRGERHGAFARKVGDLVADNFGAVTVATRAGLRAADALHGVLGTRTMSGMLEGARKLSGGRLPLWTAAMPKAASWKPGAGAAGGDQVVYFPSCAARSMGPARGQDDLDALPTATERVLRKAGFAPVYPAGLAGFCCGQPFESKGLIETADRKSAELEAALAAASEGGKLPIVFDTSPCAYRMKRFLGGRLKVLEITEALEELVLPRLKIAPRDESVTVHPVCSARKMGTDARLLRIAQACAREVVTVDEVGCCGFAGDKGFNVPELNAHALRHLADALPQACRGGYSTSRTCEIGLAHHGGKPYQSIVYLVDAASD
ncbi:MAG TPA: FAD-binding and (Fe-S)-binding domain-containing protein [Pelomicrobium sp.]|nr:FAD-binding and (Fe-S)-binding domain-containing protein [Pelomicrobium sp.]